MEGASKQVNKAGDKVNEFGYNFEKEAEDTADKTSDLAKNAKKEAQKKAGQLGAKEN